MIKKGFTLIELLVVVAIIGILAALVIVSVSGARKRANDAKIKNDISQVMNAAELHLSDSSGGAFTGDGIQAVAVKLTDGAGGTPNIVGSFVDEAGNKLLNKAPVHPVSGKNYTWETNAGGTTYRVCGELGSGADAGKFFTGNAGATSVQDSCAIDP